MTDYAIVDTNTTPGGVVKIVTHDPGVPSFPNPGHPELEWVDITDVAPQPQIGWTYDGTAFTQSQAAQDAADALATNAAYLGMTNPSNAQTTAQVRALTSQITALIQRSAPTLRRITAISPATGPRAGGTAVTLTGQGFTAISGVTFGGVSATAIVVVDDSTITCVTPPTAKGKIAVDVQVLDGARGSPILPSAFTYT
jgi:hypothetical protein